MPVRQPPSLVAMIPSLLLTLLTGAATVNAGGGSGLACAPGQPLQVVVGIQPGEGGELHGAGAAGAVALDFGRLAATAGRTGRRGIVRRETLTIRVDSCHGESGFARLWAAVPLASPEVIVRLDGVPLTPAPRLFTAAAPLGLAMRHQLEIEIAPSAADGPLAQEITWLAEID